MTNELLVKMDEHRRDFITRLQDYIGYLQEELRINTLILKSVEQSMSESRRQETTAEPPAGWALGSIGSAADADQNKARRRD